MDFFQQAVAQLAEGGQEATPEEQRVKFINLARRIQEHPDFRSKYAENQDVQNREIAFNRIFDEVMSQQRRTELDLYRMLSSDDSFRLAMMDTLKRIMRG